MLILRKRLSAVAKPDVHGTDGKYQIRSLYFDNAYDKALKEKIEGVNIREKFRIRYYNQDTSLIHLEKKSKRNQLCMKQSERLSFSQAQAIAKGDYGWMLQSGVPLIQELYSKIKSQGLKPKTIVDYTREAFVFAPGNVRVTLDYNLAFGTFQGGNVDDRPMVGWIFSDEEYTKQYHELFSQFVAEWLDSGRLTRMIEDTAELLRPYVEKDPTKFCTVEEFEKGIQAISRFVILRGEAVSRQLSGDDTPVETTDLNTSDMGTMGGGMGGRFDKGNDKERPGL